MCVGKKKGLCKVSRVLQCKETKRNERGVGESTARVLVVPRHRSTERGDMLFKRQYIALIEKFHIAIPQAKPTSSSIMSFSCD